MKTVSGCFLVLETYNYLSTLSAELFLVAIWLCNTAVKNTHLGALKSHVQGSEDKHFSEDLNDTSIS